MSLSSQEILHLCRLFATVHDRSESVAEWEELESRLSMDVAVRQLYVRYMRVCSGLAWDLRELAPLESIIATAPSLAASAQAISSTNQRSSTRRLVLPTIASRLFSRTAIGATMLVALIIYGSFTLIAWNLRPDSLPTRTLDNQTVATIQDATNVKWSLETSSKFENSPVHVGEPLKIDSGTMELELKAGTKLVVEGPADWSVDDRNSVSLRAGKLMARVPGQAIGFTVETPTAKIVDLGTEFGVKVDAAGRTDVEVLTGKVDVSYESSTTTGGSPQSVRMTAGTAKRFSKQGVGPGVAVTDVAPGMKSLLANAASTKSRRIFVQGAVASSEHDGAPATALIDGSGMKGDCHATYHSATAPVPPYHFWLTNRGRVKNEFVSFDFGQPCRLASMKVWNLNDGRDDMHKSRGVKQADIYVSTSGKWDPRKEPREWELVVKNFKFSAATGTDDYDTPDLISLGGVEARFVAIVIADHLGPDPGPWAKPGEDYVGLSEVQFFGERVKAQPASKIK